MKVSGAVIILLIAFSSAGYYELGDTVSEAHQRIAYPVCYGDYPGGYLKLEDLNGFENGGNFKVIWIEMLATW
ncbi:MAG: hypothetical protein QF472_06740 [Candidatus Marinimicrobia bacterium]|jgi:O-succinylbenzoate synthase|nr:hypothetical protein [Candidatus Neomarinimicrobiota bacterium]MDP6853632.1 hypothetical protein [Candidatus Neomarinimicrobiota bacterium]